MSEIDRDRELEARLGRAPREAEPARDLWPAVARAIADPAAGSSRSARWRTPLRIAAAIALFAGGVVVGQRWERPAPLPAAAETPYGTAAEVQRAGSEYVTALARLRAGGVGEWDQGVDAALSTLQGAAYELVRLRPDDPQAGRILYTVSEARLDGDGTPPTVRF
ncbi:MAG TPA: hypothetical protein VMR66_06415 [Gemmatimonadota bacterium]|nr:hypothetical protein [Gemmatimonadota bacterium]